MKKQKFFQLLIPPLIILFVVSSLSACGKKTAAPVITPRLPFPRIERMEISPCPFPLPSENSERITCGKVSVPEDYSRSDGPRLKVLAVRIQSSSENPAPDPLVFVSVAPGFSILPYLQYFVNSFSGYLEERDLIFYDARGVGYSTPVLDCPEAEEDYYDTLTENLDIQAKAIRASEAYKACAEKLQTTNEEEEKINLTAYSTANNAADINAIRLALGYEQINLLGIGYGSTLILSFVRDYPEIVRSAAMVDFLPPYMSRADEAVSFQKTLELVFTRCAADEKCKRAYPKLEDNFYTAVNLLNRQPAVVEIQHPSKPDFIQVAVNGNDLIFIARSLLGSIGGISKLPKLIEDVIQGRTYHLAEDYYPIFGDMRFTTSGTAISISCNDEFILVDEGAAKDVPPAIQEAIREETTWSETVCSAWIGKRPADIPQQMITSQVPMLILQGEFDADYSSILLKEQLKSLSKTTHVVFLNSGSNLFFENECADQLLENFIKNPDVEVDSSCAAENDTINFLLPLE